MIKSNCCSTCDFVLNFGWPFIGFPLALIFSLTLKTLLLFLMAVVISSLGYGTVLFRKLQKSK